MLRGPGASHLPLRGREREARRAGVLHGRGSVVLGSVVLGSVVVGSVVLGSVVLDPLPHLGGQSHLQAAAPRPAHASHRRRWRS